MLNNPKTGSTFVRKVLRDIHHRRVEKLPIINKLVYKLRLKQPDFIELKLPSIKPSNKFSNQHGTFSQIPEKFNGRTIASVIRNPYSKFLSAYEFEWWKKRPPQNLTKVKKLFPGFPNLTIDEFTDYQSLKNEPLLSNTKKSATEKNIGTQTVNFILMFSKDPLITLKNLCDDYIYSGEYKKDMADVTFLKQENLNAELHNFLKNYDYSTEDLDFVKSADKVHVTRNSKVDRHELWTKKSLDYIQIEERYLFHMLKELGIEYDAPKIY